MCQNPYFSPHDDQFCFRRPIDVSSHTDRKGPRRTYSGHFDRRKWSRSVAYSIILFVFIIFWCPRNVRSFEDLFAGDTNLVKFSNQAKMLFKKLNNAPAMQSLESGPYVFHYVIKGEWDKCQGGGAVYGLL